ncbi:MAG: hypothetical protein L3K25_07770 [Gammaproteobacteria bacterium]|nr:hypothetical protein [Gammaproteobacteria bacterium]
MTDTPNPISLSTSQAQFALLIDKFPRFSKYWDWTKRECNIEALNDEMGVMSHGERILAQFFLSVWTHENQRFDILEAAGTLDQNGRQAIIDWLTDPFWP